MGKRWHIRVHDAARVERLQRAAGIPAVVAQLLLCRGIEDPERVATFLNPKLTGLYDPELLPGVSDAADRLHAAIREKRLITIYGDYDADGMTATALLYRCLSLLGAEVNYFVPNRLDEGYGLNHEALRTLAERGTKTVVTVDCGISSVAEAATARELGLELIITDHHECPAQLPEAAAIVHPALPGSVYPFAGLCGAGVAFKLAWALCQRASEAKRVTDAMREFLLTAVGLVALGTVADVVPLVDENRILVRHGLTSLKERPVLGLARLLHIVELEKKSSLESEDIAFTLAPRLNAAGRLGQALLGVELLTTDSPDRAQSLAEYIHQLNSSRDSLERSVYLSATKQLQEEFNAEHDSALVLAGRGWHAGVIGIVAGKLAEKHHRPVVLISLDATGVKPGVGSARSPVGLHLHRALSATSEHLLGYGGHAAAAGLQISEGAIDAFRAAFCEAVSTQVPTANPAELHIDAEAPLSQLTWQTVQHLEQLAPFGAGNARPLLFADQVALAEPPRRIGGGERHLALKLKQHGTVMRAVGFGQGEAADELTRLGGLIDVAFRPIINEYKGRRSVELHLVDWRPARAPVAASS